MALRKRRTAEESRALILQVAAKRLREHGLEGLNITGVAEEAGISHATLIHHFGSSGGMRAALTQKMTSELVSDLTVAMDTDVATSTLVANVFDALSAGGHAKLLAWRSVESQDDDLIGDHISELFSRLLDSSQAKLGVDSREDLRSMVLLVATSAIGFGIAGESLANLIGLSDDEVSAFPEWLNEHLS